MPDRTAGRRGSATGKPDASEEPSRPALAHAACRMRRPACLRLHLWHVPGIFVVDKPSGPSSFDVVRMARRELGVRKIGHAGTLDPIASGVLLLGVGRATSLLSLLADLEKSYRVRAMLGRRTDTFDITGRLVAEADASGVAAETIRRVLERFRGRLRQLPPMFSALKHDGTPLYKLARKGIDIPRKPRTIEISRLELVECRPPEFALEVDCSKGTYIRSLVEDLGLALGCGAVMTGLARTRVGPFTLEEARPPGELLAPARGCAG